MISLTAILLVVGIAIGLIRGGKISNLASIDFQQPWLVFVGLGIQIAGELIAAFVSPSFREGGRGLITLALSYGFLIAFVIVNRKIPGAVFIGAGLALNLLVILPNGGMPVSSRAAHIAGFDPSGYLDTALKHRPLDAHTLFGFLGDVIPLPGLGKVVSIGDIVLGVGILILTQKLTRGSTSSEHLDAPRPDAEHPRHRDRT